ncbi:MAG: membrane protein insertion efficiency factor YidD [Deltaproteobacteria bacterium]|nr:membrane protein insertion efficiency factor YidD [Deltaproteobacteria bacterium]
MLRAKASLGAGRFVRGLIRLYQLFLSSLFPSACRFYPTCSEYAREAVSQHGVRRGLWLTSLRLMRCRPFGPRGFDPVP